MSGIWYKRLKEAVQAHGGLFNAHLHLDRAGTFEDRYLATAHHRAFEDFHISLQRKHAMIADLHAGPAFDRDDFFARVNETLEDMYQVGTRRADTMVDVTPDRVGLSGLDWMQEIKAAWAARIDIRLGAYTPFGFKDSEPQRWRMFEEGVRQADFIGCLPEADDTDDYPDHIGFEESCRRMLALAQETGKMVHVHTDQRFEDSERGTERLVEAVRQHGAPVSATGEPMVWAVHMVSPSTYDDARFYRLAEDMAALKIGLIACPSAALGMRMLRPLNSPTGNAMPRVLELVACGVHVRMGSDNIADICSPSTTPDLIDEAMILSSALRFYNPEVIAKLLCGEAPDQADRAFVGDHLARNGAEIDKALAKRAFRMGAAHA